MPHYKLTGMHSHRHPFAGEGDLINLDAPLAPGIYEGLAAEDENLEGVSVGKIARPFVAGLVNGIIVYGLARTFNVDAKKAKKVSFVFGGVTTLFGIASDYLYREMQALMSSGSSVKPAGT